MGVFFGTDGIRGVVNQSLTSEVAYRCGNALASSGKNLKILIGSDTRKTCDMLMLSFSAGATNAGASVTNIGVCPTAGVSFLTHKFGFDYGVVISASHNSAEYNGIKIVDKNGLKLGEKREQKLERLLFQNQQMLFNSVGKFKFSPELVREYAKFLTDSFQVNLSKKTIVLDCANGAASEIAPKIFREKGANVICLGSIPNGLNINENCGSLHIENLTNAVIKNGADMGFSFDGDSDRVVAVDERGNVIDGDAIIYIFSVFYKENRKLNPLKVVGTHHTNMGVEKALNKHGITLIRTDIGDKFVNQKLMEENLIIGGEQSGHVMVKDKLMTGDGVLNALMIADICVKKNKNLSEFVDFSKYKQTNINVEVDDKNKIMENKKLNQMCISEEKQLRDKGRILIRASGTEPYVRVMVESEDEELSQSICERFACLIKDLNEGIDSCVE